MPANLAWENRGEAEKARSAMPHTPTPRLTWPKGMGQADLIDDDTAPFAVLRRKMRKRIERRLKRIVALHGAVAKVRRRQARTRRPGRSRSRAERGKRGIER
jgi:hypothetical protein